MKIIITILRITPSIRYKPPKWILPGSDKLQLITDKNLKLSMKGNRADDGQTKMFFPSWYTYLRTTIRPQSFPEKFFVPNYSRKRQKDKREIASYSVFVWKYQAEALVKLVIFRLK